MAKKFKSTSPRSDKPSGVSVSDILAFAAGKSPGEALTAQDIDVAVKKAGISGKDARAIREASDKFLSSGNQFMLQGDGNYNVYGQEGQVTTSKRSTGNKVGFNAGDIVGLGNNMSKLVGLAKMYKGAFDESKKAQSAPSKEETAPETKTPKSETKAGAPSADRRLTAREIMEAQARAQGMLDSLQTPADIAARNKSQDLIMNNQPEKDKGFGDWRDDGKNPGQSPAKKKGRTTPGMPEEENLIFGNLISAFDPRTYERLGIAFNPAQIWDEAARQKARTMAQEDLQEMGRKKGDAQSKESITIGMPNMGLFTPTPKPIFSQPGKAIGKGVDALGNKMKSAFDALSKKIAPKVNMPQVQKEVLQLPQKASKPRIKMPKESPFEQGGKLPKYAAGGRTPDGRKPRYGTAGIPPLSLGGGNSTGLKPTIQNTEASKSSLLKNFDPSTVPSLGTLAQPSANENGAFNTANLMAGGNHTEAGDGNALAAFGKVAKYALPFIGTHLANRELGKVKPVNLKKANLMTGVVSDIPRPNMGLRYRVPTGNDIQTEIAGQKFADAQARDAEANYNVANAQSRIGQRQQIVNNQNRNEMFNTQTENQARMFNAQQLMGLQGARSQNVQEPFIAAQHHLATDISTDAFLKSSRDVEGAEAILKSAPFGSPEWKEAAKKMGFKKGGKIKAKR